MYTFCDFIYDTWLRIKFQSSNQLQITLLTEAATQETQETAC